MLMQSRLCRLALNYSNADAHCFVQQQFYLPPYSAEDSAHYAKRLLTLTALTEQHPAVAAEHLRHKFPDFEIQYQHHIQLWAQVDVPDDRHLRRACHKADCVLLCSEPEHFSKIKEFSHHPQVVFAPIDVSVIEIAEQWLQPTMQWSAWRDGEQLQLTNGEQLLEFAFPYDQLDQRLTLAHERLGLNG